MSENSPSFDPVRQVFADITKSSLIRSVAKIFWRIWRQQGLSGAWRVIPICQMIIKTVTGFAHYHVREYERMRELNSAGGDLEEVALSAEEFEEYRQLGRWLREELYKLGPTFIKIGQTLSTRADLVPLPALIELARLQEEVEPFDSAVAMEIIQKELGAPAEKLFASFEPVPIAAASLSQAYRAVLADGRDVVVKVQRPDLAQAVARDVQVLAAVAEEVMNYPSLCRHTDWPGVVDEFARTTFEELDYIREGRNADRFRHNFRNSIHIYIPRIIWRLTGRKVLTIEYVAGARVNDSDAIEAMGLDRNELTAIGANFYLRQLLEDGFFHADPHPGNMRIMADGRIGIFDFGMVGRLPAELKNSMVNAFMHVIKQDYRGVIDDFVDMGFLRPDVDRDQLCQDLTPIIEARFAEGMSKVHFRKVVFDFSDVVYRYPFRLPSEFTYVMRALLTLEGVALAINPEFHFVEAAMPFAQKLIFKEGGAGLRAALLKEVFADGRFQPGKAMDLLRTAARLSSAN